MLSSTHVSARGAARRRRAAITTAAALVAAAAFAVPAQAALTPSANDPNTTMPQTFTDDTGLALDICSNANCVVPGPRPHLDAPLAVPGNFDADGEAFWYSATADLPSGTAEFAVEAAFLGAIAPGQGSVFTRQRFRFDHLVGTYRLTTPYGSKIYPNLDGRTRAINDTIDLGCPAAPCDYQAADYGTEMTVFLRPVGWTPGAPGTVSNTTGPVMGAPTGYNGVKLEKEVPVSDENPSGWELVEEQTAFTVQTQIASAPSAPAPFASAGTTSVAFPARRSDEASGNKLVTIRNDGAAPLTISSTVLSGPEKDSFTATGCAETIAPRGSCTVTVRFVATSVVGGHDATLTINNDSVNAPAIDIALSGTITSLAAPPAPSPKPPAERATGTTQPTTILQLVPAPGPAPAAVPVAPAQAVSPVTATAPTVSRVTVARRISATRLRVQGLRAAMRVKEGTNVVRIAVYKARDGHKTGKALYVTHRVPLKAGLMRVTLRSSALLRKLKAGSYVAEVRAGQNVSALGAASAIGFRVTR